MKIIFLDLYPVWSSFLKIIFLVSNFLPISQVFICFTKNLFPDFRFPISEIPILIIFTPDSIFLFSDFSILLFPNPNSEFQFPKSAIREPSSDLQIPMSAQPSARGSRLRGRRVTFLRISSWNKHVGNCYSLLRIKCSAESSKVISQICACNSMPTSILFLLPQLISLKSLLTESYI